MCPLPRFAGDLANRYYDAIRRGTPAGISLPTLIGACVSRIGEAAPSVPATWKQFVGEAKPAANPADAKDEYAEARLAKLAGVGAGEKQVCPPGSAWSALKLIAVVWQRARARADLSEPSSAGSTKKASTRW